MKKLTRLILARTTLITFLFLLQMTLFFVMAYYLSQTAYIIQSLFTLMSFLIVVYILAKDENPMYKLSWIVPILLFPLFGGIFYLFYRQINISSNVIFKHQQIDAKRIEYIKKRNDVSDHKIAHYLDQLAWPSYNHTDIAFLSSGKSMFDILLKDLDQAESFIFIEFFIISKGKIWKDVLEVLLRKIKQGVDVKLIYDDFGSSEKLPFRHHRKLKKFGIDVLIFNPMKPHLNFAMNYRDHRKIIVIDGKVGYTGGINIGDEYANIKQRFGHWQDAAIRLEGDAVHSLSMIFLENYQFTLNKHIDYAPYDITYEKEPNGMVIPFSDTPLDNELTTKNIYLNLIMQAQSSIDITTPYLIIDHELSTALKLAARSGVRVRIVIPKKPDKKLIYIVTESFANELILSGIEIYQYDPGFIHSKLIIIDQSYAMIGTANFDFRSLYLHFENSVYLEHHTVIKDMITYFNQSIEKSSQVKDVKKRNVFYRAFQMLLRGFSPLL